MTHDSVRQDEPTRTLTRRELRERERAEAERLAEEQRLAAVRAEAERAEAERLVRVQAVLERLETERLEAERRASEKAAAEREEIEKIRTQSIPTITRSTPVVAAERVESTGVAQDAHAARPPMSRRELRERERRAAEAAAAAEQAHPMPASAPSAPAPVASVSVTRAEAKQAASVVHELRTDSIAVPLSFRRNEEALRPVAARMGSSRAVVRVRNPREKHTPSTNVFVRGMAGAAAIGIAGTIAITSTLPANANGGAVSADQISVDSVQDVSVPGNVQTASFDRDGGYSVTTMGTATLYNVSNPALQVAPTYTNDFSAAVQWPFPLGVVLTDRYGYRPSPCGGCSSDHKGVDFTPGIGTPIGSIADGRVVQVQTSDNGGLGIYVIVKHIVNGEVVYSVYAHMLHDSVTVEVGDVVRVGDELGKVGNTGSSTGPHLHLEIHVGKYMQHTDPFAFLEEFNVPTTVVSVPDDVSMT